MKNRILLSIGLICSFMGMNIQEGMGQCTSCSGTATGSGAIAIGGNANGFKAVALSADASAVNSNAVAVGEATSNGVSAYSFGSKVFANGDNSFAIGYKAMASSSATFNYVFGAGLLNNDLVNSENNSIMFGMNSDVSTVFIGNSGGSQNSYGNVGIGNIINPASLLHVRSQVRVGLSGGADGSLVFNNSASNTITFNTPASMSSQSYTLPTAGTTTSGSVLANDGTGQLLWAAPGTVSNAWLLTGNTIASTDWLGTINGLDLVVKTTNLERMRVMAAGNVGIGTSTPDGLLHLNATNTYMIVEKGTANEGGMVWHNGPQSAGTANASLMFETDETLRLRNAMINENVVINVNDDGDNKEALFVEGNSAHVGIGTSNPLMRLHVVAPEAVGDDESLARFAVNDNSAAFIQLENIDDTDGEFAGGIRSISSTSTYPALLFAAAVDATDDTGSEPMMVFSPRRLGSTTITTRPLFEWANNTSTEMLMDVAGNLGIGTTTPLQTLHVAGTVRVNTLPPDGSGNRVGYNASSFQLTDWDASSIHFKDEIQSLSFDRDAFLSMRPVSYKWKEIYGGSQDVGFVAQQVAEDFPPLATLRHKHTILEDGTIVRDSLGMAIVDSTQLEPYSVKYGRLPVYLFMLAKQQDSVIQALVQRVDQLQGLLEHCCAQPSFRLEEENPIQEAELLKINEYEEFVLLQNDPNPFADYTDIQLTLPNSAKNASLLIVNMKGSVMLNVPLYGGSETIRVYSSDIGKGIFTYYLLNEGNVVASRKMVSSK